LGLGYAAIYVGPAERALEFTADFCKTHRFEPDPDTRAHNPVVQRHVAEMVMAVGAARTAPFRSSACSATCERRL
jgi:alkylation response protein AidB-like acyl-CoA dehydrogenase